MTALDTVIGAAILLFFVVIFVVVFFAVLNWVYPVDVIMTTYITGDVIQ